MPDEKMKEGCDCDDSRSERNRERNGKRDSDRYGWQIYFRGIIFYCCVAVSALEMSQNSMRYQWTAEEVDAKLHQIMKGIYAKAKAMSIEYNTTLAAGANIAGFKKVADAMLAQGIY